VDATVNVRFIAATNQDPASAVAQGKLRGDLHFRLRVVPIHIPPLRERTEDIPVLAQHFLDYFWNEHRSPSDATPTFTREAIEDLTRRPWRGNVRELRNVIEHAVVMLDAGAEIRPQDLPSFEDELPGDAPAALYDRSIIGQSYHVARERVLSDFERFYLRHIVREARGNISDAARIAAVDRTTLYRLMEKHGTERQSLLTE
jgi:DNA-binding NtrC family response regulator